jgi:DNA (cytosine-5)-methyltransferase 1
MTSEINVSDFLSDNFHGKSVGILLKNACKNLNLKISGTNSEKLNRVQDALERSNDEHSGKKITIDLFKVQRKEISKDPENVIFEHIDKQIDNGEIYKFIDLFSGIGSFHYSLSKLGMKCIMASDIDDNARKIYEANYNMSPLGDIVKINPEIISPYDILCAGFSCQPFSNIGQHKGFKDKKHGTMFHQIMKFADYHKPRIIILENVMGLLKHDSGKTLRRMLKMLKHYSYNVLHGVLKCSDYGIPQMRKRLFIVCIRNKKFPDNFNNWESFKTSSPTLSEFFGKNFEKTESYTIRCGGRRSPINDKHNWDGYIVDDKEYRLTPTDCLKLQGFPDNFIMVGTDTDKYMRLGNTIPTNLTTLVGKKCKELLDQWDSLTDEIVKNDEAIEENTDDDNDNYETHIKDLKTHFNNTTINSLETMNQIYTKCISIFQKKKACSGAEFEKEMETQLNQSAIKYNRQVSINSKGIIQKRSNADSDIPDIVIGNVIIGSSITDYIVISCKKTCRERWKQDGWTLIHQPKLFILATNSDDYPSPIDKFGESEIRKIATRKPKKNDIRKYKLDLNDIVNEIKHNL